jgi:hypothetical protein
MVWILHSNFTTVGDESNALAVSLQDTHEERNLSLRNCGVEGHLR